MHKQGKGFLSQAYTTIKTRRLSVMEAVSVMGSLCTESRPELETLNK